MAYSDYGGYAYRNGTRVEARSDCQISPDGDMYGKPGMWPGFAAMIDGGQVEYKKRKEWPSGHAVLGDGPVYVVLYKQTTIMIYRGSDRLDAIDILVGYIPDGAVKNYEYDGKKGRYIEYEAFIRSGKPAVFGVDGCVITVHWVETDNYYQYARLEQPDGVVWHGWSGYGVGAGLEECDYGYSTPERESDLLEYWPDAINSPEMTQNIAA